MKYRNVRRRRIDRWVRRSAEMLVQYGRDDLVPPCVMRQYNRDAARRLRNMARQAEKTGLYV